MEDHGAAAEVALRKGGAVVSRWSSKLLCPFCSLSPAVGTVIECVQQKSGKTETKRTKGCLQAVERDKDSRAENRKLLMNFWAPHPPMRGTGACAGPQTVRTDLKAVSGAVHCLDCRLD